MMNKDLFSPQTEFEDITIKNGKLTYWSNVDFGRDSHKLMREIISTTPWRQESIVIWGKKIPQPRLVAWYGDAGQNYAYSGIKLNPLPWTELLRSIKSKVEETSGEIFNSVLLNYYRDNQDSIGMHSDDEKELGKLPIIASVSFGEIRTFVMKHKTDRNCKSVRLLLASGSLLVMKEETQNHWKHGIQKETLAKGPRVNLTFRKICV